jgi:hypothetical protein
MSRERWPTTRLTSSIQARTVAATAGAMKLAGHGFEPSGEWATGATRRDLADRVGESPSMPFVTCSRPMFVGNRLSYATRHVIDRQRLPTRCGFVHVPLCTKQVDTDTPGIGTDTPGIGTDTPGVETDTPGCRYGRAAGRGGSTEIDQSALCRARDSSRRSSAAYGSSTRWPSIRSKTE